MEDNTGNYSNTKEKSIVEETIPETNEWYVIQTMSGKEDILIRYIEEYVDSSVVKECFIPKRERKKKIDGKWIQKSCLEATYL